LRRALPCLLVLAWLLAATPSAPGGEAEAPDPEAELQAKLAERHRRAIELAELHEADGDWRRATAHYEMARRIRPNDPDVLNQLARLYRSHNDDASLLPVYEALVRLQPASMSCLRELGSCHFRLGHREEAEAAWRKILEVQPSRTYALRHLGQIYTGHGLFDEAAAAFRHALALAPNDDDVRLRLAEALESGGDHLAALTTIARLAEERTTARSIRAERIRQVAFIALALPPAVRVALERRLADPAASPTDLAWDVARALEASGDPRRAAVHYRRVARDEPDTPRGKEAAQKTDKLSPRPDR